RVARPDGHRVAYRHSHVVDHGNNPSLQWMGNSRYIPSFEEGTRSRSSQMVRYLKIGAAAEVRHILQRDFGPPRPRRFLEVVARHLVRRGGPPRRRGYVATIPIHSQLYSLAQGPTGLAF